MSTTIVKKLFWLSAFCCLLELIRLAASSSHSFIFLPGNLILAWIPMLFALLMQRQQRPVLLLTCFGVWLAFFPNAPYIITDLLHLKPRNGIPFWYDTVLLYSFALTGLLVGMFSALIVYNRLKELMPQWVARFSLIGIMLISGYGIYLGRFLRWNSWDLVTQPDEIFIDTLQRLAHPFTYPRAYTMSLVIGILLWLVFSVFESLAAKAEAQTSTTSK
jgi:uncharacterized membrane protein